MYDSDKNVRNLIKLIDAYKNYLIFMFVNVSLGKTKNIKTTISTIIINFR